jgi:hypothetical protein
VPHQRIRLEPAGAEHTAAERLGTSQVGVDLLGAQHTGRAQDGPDEVPEGERDEGDGIRTLLDVVGQLVERARESGELRGDVSVADVLLVIATAAPALPDPDQHAAASARLLDILLEGLRSRPGERAAAPAGPR